MRGRFITAGEFFELRDLGGLRVCHRQLLPLGDMATP